MHSIKERLESIEEKHSITLYPSALSILLGAKGGEEGIRTKTLRRNPSFLVVSLVSFYARVCPSLTEKESLLKSLLLSNPAPFSFKLLILLLFHSN